MKVIIKVTTVAIFWLAMVVEAKVPEMQPKLAPFAGLTVDYIAGQDPQIGFTLMPYHFDRNYSDWGYYIGFARGKTIKQERQLPEKAEIQHYSYRFGLSYSLSQSFSLYGGLATDTFEQRYSAGVAPQIVGGKASWTSDRETRWGAEMGARYCLEFGMILSLGYSTAHDRAVAGIGIRF